MCTGSVLLRSSGDWPADGQQPGRLAVGRQLRQISRYSRRRQVTIESRRRCRVLDNALSSLPCSLRASMDYIHLGARFTENLKKKNFGETWD